MKVIEVKGNLYIIKRKFPKFWAYTILFVGGNYARYVKPRGK